MLPKMSLHQQLPRVKGTVLWYAKAVVDNVGNYGTTLRNVYWRTPALQPVMEHIDKKAPKKVGATKKTSSTKKTITAKRGKDKK